MKRFLLLSIVIIFSVSSPAFTAIVYRGGQNVIVKVGSPAIISIADYPDEWDDFIINLEYEMTMDMMGTRLTIGGMMDLGMGMGMVMVRSLDAGMIPPAMNLAYGDMIGPDSLFAESALLLEAMDGQPIGEFGAEGGYIGLSMPGSTFYAWLHMSGMTDIGLITQTGTFDCWAYEDVANKPIGAGVIPLPGAIALVGLGIGLVTWLRKRRAL